MSGVYSKARERIAAMDALAWSIAASASLRGRGGTHAPQPVRKNPEAQGLQIDIADGHDIELWITPDGKLFGKKEK